MFYVWFVIGVLSAIGVLSVLPWFYYSHWIRDKKLVNEKIPKWKDTNKPKKWLAYWLATHYTCIIIYLIVYVIMLSLELDDVHYIAWVVFSVFVALVYSVIVIAINAWIINIIAKRANNGIKKSARADIL